MEMEISLKNHKKFVTRFKIKQSGFTINEYENMKSWET